MGIFDSIQNLIQNGADSLPDAISGLTENLPIEEIGNITESASGAADTATTAVDDLKGSIGL